ncbi:hypothetical protein F4677DRAFT_444525 [Hypoxylon crocopeplum]|nr:hypothetical protein F4677DRAFT_444525 [Hypoxylon crocopeplum]
MARTITVSATTEILASPAIVRSVFLDFPRYKQWYPGMFIEPVDSGKKPSELVKGDRLKLSIGGLPFRAPVTENSTNCFSWDGSFFGLVSGHHQFFFSPSKENPGSTTFTNKEDYSGALLIFFGDGENVKKNSEVNYEKFNEALKNEVEKPSS